MQTQCIKDGRMHTGERKINSAIAEVLNNMRSDWKIGGEKEGKILKSGNKPDIIITEDGSMPVIIETELLPASTLERDVNQKLGDETVRGQKINAVIGMRIPTRLKQYDDEKLRMELRKAWDLEYAMYTPERFPDNGWITGGLADIASNAQIISINSAKITESVAVMSESIVSIADLIEKCGADTKRNIAAKLHQKEIRQTWNMAGLILSNALIFHTHIAGQRGIRTLLDISVLGEIYPLDLMKAWAEILKINYFAIFQVAGKILSFMDDNTAREVISHLITMNNQISRTGLTHSTDMYGALIQKMIKDRKTLASFYTRSESAALLSSFITPPPDSPLYKNKEAMLSVSMADLACGTGTLLSSLYRNLIRNYEINGGDMKKIHAKMVANNIYGFDVLPSAVHLTASTLADVFPKIIFEVSKIATVFLGKHSGALHLGSLDLISDMLVFDQKGMLVVSDSEQPYNAQDLHGKTFDMVIMNPPFTSNTREGGKEGYALFSSFDIDKGTQKDMTKLEKEMFRQTCANGNAGVASNFIAVADKKLNPGGILGLVLPATLTKGSSWSEARKLLNLKYDGLTIVSMAGPETVDGSFSFDTSINEILLIARKIGKAKHEEIMDALKRLHTVSKQVAAVNVNVKGKKRKAAMMQRLKSRQAEKDKLEKYLADAARLKRGLFVSLEQRPQSVLHAVSISRYVRCTRDVLKYEKGITGGTPITLGGINVGNMMDCPLDDDWGFVNVYDAALLQCVYNLARGVFQPIGRMESYDVPMTTLGDNLGPISRDVADNKPNDRRAPFMTFQHDKTAIYHALSNNNAKIQKTLTVSPDAKAVPKACASPDKIKKIAKTASRLHVNILCRYNSQFLTVLYSKEKTLCTGASLPNYYIAAKYEKAFAVWGNSTFGILCHWWHSGKQVFGRGITSSTAIQEMPVLDFVSLSDEKIRKFNKLFNDNADKPLLKIMDLNLDKTRRSLDNGIMDILGIKTSLDDIRKRLADEPAIHGHKQSAVSQER